LRNRQHQWWWNSNADANFDFDDASAHRDGHDHGPCADVDDARGDAHLHRRCEERRRDRR
jgi:hypothetical protein